MTGCAAVGSLGIMLVEPRAAIGDADPTFDGSSERYAFLYETFRAKRPVKPSRMIFGNRDLNSAKVIKGAYVPRGAVGFQLGPTELDAWLPRMNGAVASGDTFPFGDTYPLFDCMFNRDNAVVYLRGCQVAAYVFQSKSSDAEEEDEILNMQLVMIARSEDLTKSWPGSVPTIAEGEGYNPYAHPQLTGGFDGTDYDIEELKIVVDNGLRPKVRNYMSPNCVYAGPRRVSVEMIAPYTSALWTDWQEIYSTGLDASFVYAVGSGADPSLTFDFPHLITDLEPPTIRTHEEILARIEMKALRTSTDAPLLITNVT